VPARSGCWPRCSLASDLGAHYHSTEVSGLAIAPEIVIECTGIGQLAVAATRLAAPGAVVALTGISHSDRVSEAHPDVMNKALVLGNKAVFGTVNAARRHYDQAADALAQANPDWLARIITRRLPADQWPAALDKRPEDIKIVIEMDESAP
jgi:glucose 1-dehydrogenase